MTYEHKGKGKGGYCLDKKIFISHSSKDVRYVEKIIDLIVDMGVREKQIFCSSVPGFGIPMDKDIYDYLAEEFSRTDVHVILCFRATTIKVFPV